MQTQNSKPKGKYLPKQYQINMADVKNPDVSAKLYINHLIVQDIPFLGWQAWLQLYPFYSVSITKYNWYAHFTLAKEAKLGMKNIEWKGTATAVQN